jgi:hypothetical protein
MNQTIDNDSYKQIIISLLDNRNECDFIINS